MTSNHNKHEPSSSESALQLREALELYLEQLEERCVPNPEEFVARYPAIADQLRQHLAGLDFIHLASTNLATTDLSSSIPDNVKELGDFRLIREIGRGGMGVVYEAQQLSLGRPIALKVLPFAAMLDDRQLMRFRNEAKAAASLRHANIVGVHSVGTDRGVHYYAMELVEGQSLADIIESMRDGKGQQDNRKEFGNDSSNSVPDTDALGLISTHRSNDRKSFYIGVARLGIQIAEALEYAHQVGIVHRDIKPSNLLVDHNGKPWVTDFGLAMRHADSNLTVSGDLMGTLRYMSPEQAAGRNGSVDHHTDIYSLGATLYELLTLVPAFPEADRNQLLRDLDEREPCPPRKISTSIPKDLETIVLKSMAKSIGDRYETAKELADDLQRFVEVKPIVARRNNCISRACRWARRNRALSITSFTVCALLLVLGIAGPLIALKQASLVSTERKHRRMLHQSTSQLRQRNYAHGVASAYQAWNEGRLDSVKELLEQQIPQSGEPDLRGFEWQYLNAKFQRSQLIPTFRHDSPLSRADLTNDGRIVATGCRDGSLHIWDRRANHRIRSMQAHDSRLRAVQFATMNDDQVIITATNDEIKVWNAETLDQLKSMDDFSAKIFALTVAPNGKSIAIAVGQQIELWNLSRLHENNDPDQRLEGHTDRVMNLAFSANGEQLVSVAGDRTAKIWNTANGQCWKDLFGHSDSLTAVAVASTGDIATGDKDHIIRLWNEKGVFKGQIDMSTSGQSSFTFSSDGKTLAIASGLGTIDLWSLTQNSVVDRLRGHEDKIKALIFTDEDQTLISASFDGTLKCWNLMPTSKTSLPPQTNYFHKLDCSSDGIIASAISLNSQSQISLYDAELNPLKPIRLSVQRIHQVVFSPTQKNQLAITVLHQTNEHITNEIWLLDILTGNVTKRISIPSVDGGNVFTNRLSYSNDGMLLACSVPIRTSNKVKPEVWLFHIESGEVDSKFPGCGSRGACSLSFSTDDKFLAQTGGSLFDGHAETWDIKRSKLVREFPIQTNRGISAFFSPDGKELIIAYRNVLKVWNISTGQSRWSVRSHAGTISMTALSPDSRTLATAGDDGIVRLWNFQTSFLLAEFKASASVSSIVFTPNGRVLIAACGDGSLNSWDTNGNIKHVPQAFANN